MYILLNNTQLVLSLNHESNLNMFFFLFYLLGFFIMQQKFQTYIQIFFSLKSDSHLAKNIVLCAWLKAF